MAEESGFHSIWLAERHFQPQRSVLSSPITVAAAIADRTERVRVGIAVQVLPLNHPIRIAEEAATVDQISQGRFNFGIGRSGLTISYSGYNIPYSESRGRFWEALEVILKAWTTDEFSYEGEFYNFHNVRPDAQAGAEAPPAHAHGLRQPGELCPGRQHGHSHIC